MKVEPASKLKLIKEVKNILGIGLKDAKDIVEKLPSLLREKVPLEEAEAIQAKLQALGCKIELK